ncbi:flavodoxin [Streptomyces zaomyceticus]|uniref:flavodoxin n=1 Tax=Streptomyces zaomyceticus TaxID=68286 RepID=UPI0036A2BD76
MPRTPGYRIRAVVPYPREYDATVKRNVREQEADARPAIEGRLPSLDGYDTILLASPIWNVRAPMIMTTFAEALDFRGKTVHPVTTYAMSGMGTTERDYATSCRSRGMDATYRAARPVTVPDGHVTDRLDPTGSRRVASVRHRTASHVATASGLQVPPNALNPFIEPTKNRGLCTSCLVKGFENPRTCALRRR